MPPAELTLTTLMTPDGVTQVPGGPAEDPSGGFRHGGWRAPHADEVMGATIVEILSKAGAFLPGRRTNDVFAAHRYKATDPSDPIAAKLDAPPRYVASR